MKLQSKLKPKLTFKLRRKLMTAWRARELGIEDAPTTLAARSVIYYQKKKGSGSEPRGGRPRLPGDDGGK